MPAKTPIYLKSSGKNGGGLKSGKKLREILSTDMISPPLGDFRHMAHVGRGGTDDMFGDTSFLQKGNSSLLGNSSTRKSDSNLTNGSSSFRRGGSVGKKEKGSKKGRFLFHEQSSTLDRFKRKKNNNVKSGMTSDGECNAELSPVLQSAFSLPVLSNDSAPTSPAHTGASDEPAEQTSSENAAEAPAQNSASSTTTPKPQNGFGGPPKPRRILSVKIEDQAPKREPKEEEKSNLAEVDKLSPLRRSSEVLSEMPACIHKSRSPDSEEDGWSFSLDLGPSLMDEIMDMMGGESKVAV